MSLFAPVVLLAHVVPGEVDDGLEEDHEVLDEAGIAVAEELHLHEGAVVDAHRHVGPHLGRQEGQRLRARRLFSSLREGRQIRYSITLLLGSLT